MVSGAGESGTGGGAASHGAAAVRTYVREWAYYMMDVLPPNTS